MECSSKYITYEIKMKPKTEARKPSCILTDRSLEDSTTHSRSYPQAQHVPAVWLIEEAVTVASCFTSHLSLAVVRVHMCAPQYLTQTTSCQAR